MKVPLKWLKQYVDLTLPIVEIARRLTMSGNEAGIVYTTAGKWENVMVGQIKAVNPHPNADRLHLITVALGSSEETIVCGAPNLNTGDKIAFARVGAELFDTHTGTNIKLTPAKIRGVVSAGMACSEKELGISENHEGIMVLPVDAPVGNPLAEYLGDVIFDIEVTPNRPDCLSIIGIAREVSALTGQPLHLPDLAYQEVGNPIDTQLSVEIVDPVLCPRYCASLVTGVKIAESPSWMQERLLAHGMRPINNIVDITNFVMLEYGQPLHAFDYRSLRGKKIIVRPARPGENLMTLDSNVRELASDMLVIADQERAVALAGVMGGANSEVTINTTAILLESANFKATSIHYTARKLGLNSEASMRFERGIRPGLTIPALRRATQLMIELGGGQAACGIADAYPGLQPEAPINVSTGEFKRILGKEYSVDQIQTTLVSLGFETQIEDNCRVKAKPPYWRGDIKRPVDLVEEVARINGYDQIPTSLLSGAIPHRQPNPLVTAKQRIRQSMAAGGFQEIVTYSLISADSLAKLSPSGQTGGTTPIRMANPMTADQEYLRTSLLPNLLATLAANRKHDSGPVCLFELGKVHLPRAGELPEEPEMLGAVMNGPREDKTWFGEPVLMEFFDIKGVAESLLSRIGVTAEFNPSSHESLHPSKQMSITVDGKVLGTFGELHPKVRDNFEIADAVFVLEIDVTALTPYADKLRLYQPISRFPAIIRDMALVVDYQITHRQVYDIIRGSPLVNEVSLFDVYAGKQVPEGKKSLAYRVVYQSPSQTLTEDEVNTIQERLLRKLKAVLGATLRT